MASPGSALRPKAAGYATFSPLEAKRSPEDAPLLSWLLFSFGSSLLAAGNARQLQHEDLWPLRGRNDLSRAFAAFERNFRRLRRPSLVKAIADTYGLEFALYGLAALLSSFCASVAAPVTLHQVIESFSAPEVDVAAVAGWLAGFLALKLVDAVVAAHANFRRETVVIKLLTSVKMLVFRKVLRRSPAAANSAGVEPQTLLTVDSGTLMHAAFQVNNLWLLPLETVVIMALLYATLGVAAFAGAAVAIVSVLLGAGVARLSGATYSQIMSNRDVRMKTVKQVLGAIQTVKLNAWDAKFTAKILDLRVVELGCITTYMVLSALTTFVLWASPIFVSAASFAVYVLYLGQTLTAAKVFTAIALFNALRGPLRDFPGAIQIMERARVAVGRLDEFLVLEEVDNNNAGTAQQDLGGDIAISVSDGTFSWSTGSPDENALPTLRKVNLTIQKGDLAVVHGVVGSGKSSLIAAILGDMKKLSGNVAVRGRIAYYSQQPWIQNASVRDNILFGQKFERAKYERVLVACGLVPDLESFPHGDRTEIGQKGVTLSGGQKARVSLARACYSDADILFLDSPLAAVDVVVQREIIDNCIGELLKNKTVVLGTHNPEMIQSNIVSVRVHVDNGEIIVTEIPEARLRRTRGNNIDLDKQVASIPAGVVLSVAADSTQKETREQGRVSNLVFLEYFRTFGGLKMCLLLVVIGFLGQGFQIAADLWLSNWTGQKQGTSDVSKTDTKFKMEVYAVLGAAGAVMVLARSATIAFAGIQASKHIFNAMTRGVMRSPLRFFDVNPIGRLVNRFSDDMSAVDFTLSSSFGNFFPTSLTVLCQLATAVYSVNLSLGFLVLPLLYVYLRLGGFTLGPSREIARLWLSSRSPVLSYASEVSDGAAVIRAFGPAFVQRVMDENCARISRNSQAWYSENITTHWFQIRIKFLGCVTIATVMAVALYLRDSIAPGFVGLAFAYALSVDSSLALLVERWSWIEVSMVSAERVLEYAALEPEDAKQVLVVEPASDWPKKETVTFENVVFSYKPGDEPVLKNVSFSIGAKEKVGIVGRTGAGKSSLAMALFRVNDLVSGHILIYGVDISTLPLQTLRSRIAIIPQSPVLFKGALREYMDPFGEFSDANIWSSLEKVDMKERLVQLGGGLAFELSENGENFSVGERQLLCMARALLTKSRIVVMDEATASIDHGTEKKLQEMIDRDFQGATVLTIAHRLATVERSDRVLVMSDGKAVEFGSPKELATDSRSAFHRLAKEAGRLHGLIQ